MARQIKIPCACPRMPEQVDSLNFGNDGGNGLVLLQRDGFTRISGNRWLNDESVAASIELFWIWMRSRLGPRKVYIFDSLTLSSHWDKTRYVWGKVERLKKLDLIGYDIVIFVIHRDDHWLYGVMDTLEKRVHVFDSLTQPGI